MGGAAHRGEEGVAGGFEKFLEAVKAAVLNVFGEGGEAACHADAVVTVAEVTVGLRKEGFGLNNVLRDFEKHRLSLLDTQSASRA